MRRRFLALNPAGVIGEVRAITTAVPLGAFLRGIDLPVLVVHGTDDDVWTPAEQRLLTRTANGARRVPIPASIHSPQLENPVAWIRSMTRFLRSVEPDSPAGHGHHEPAAVGYSAGPMRA